LEIEKEISYPQELTDYLKERISKAIFKLQENAFHDVLDWITDRKFTVTVDVEPDELGEPDYDSRNDAKGD
jgi:hypothetical protein